jgi:hypothetical protein
MSAGTLVVKIAANITDFSNGLDAAEKRLMRAGDKLATLGGNLTTRVTAPLIAAAGFFAQSAAEDAASVEKLGRVFGKAQGDMEQFAQSLMKSVPETDDALRGMASTTGTLLMQLGLAPQKATAMSQTVLRLAGDFGAFNKELGVAGAADALDKALMGKTKGLAGFGVAISEADIKQKAYKLGLATVGEELSKAATAQAALTLVLERSTKIQGEASRTYGSDANALARLKQAADGVADSFGAVVLPTFVQVMNGAKGLLDGLTALPGPMKSVIVAGFAVGASIGPLAYVVGNLTKAFTLLRAAGAALGFFSLSQTIFGVQAAFGAAAIAGTGFRGVMIGLGPVMAPFLLTGAIVAGVLAIGAAFWKAGEAARKAAADTENFKAKLASLSSAKDSQAEAKALVAKIAELDARPAWVGDLAMFEEGRRKTERAGLVEQLRAANARSRQLAAPDLPTITPPDVPGSGKEKKDPYAKLEANASLLGRVYELTNAKGHPLVGLNGRITETIDALNLALSQQKNQWGEVALRIREATESLKRYGEATLLAGNAQLPSLTYKQVIAKMGNVQGNSSQIPGVNAPVPTIGTADIPAALRAQVNQPLITQVSLQQRMVASLATLPGEFAATLGSYLGPVIAKMGGGTGGAIGAALGGATGKALATAAITSAAGQVAGGVIGSVVPVVGTILGSMAGAAIGGAIGKLFGRSNTAADGAAAALQRMADAARKVQEAITGLPQGIKIAAYQFEASNSASAAGAGDSGRTATGKSSSSSAGGRTMVFSGPMHFHGVQNVQELYRQLVAEGENQDRRGGSFGFQLATAGL